MPDIVHAPWTGDQIDSLNACQQAGFLHEYTCGNAPCRQRTGGILVATRDGWVCPDCDYRQGWAQRDMTDWTWTQWRFLP